MTDEIEPLTAETLDEAPYSNEGVLNAMALVAYCAQLGFQKVTIIDRASYAPIGYTDATHIATAWADAEGNQINENQELLNDWTDASNPSFHFYATKFNIILRDPDGAGNWIVGQVGKQVIVAAKFTNPGWYFIASGQTKSKGKKVEGEVGFAGAPGALTAIQKNCWDAMWERADNMEG